MTFQPSSEQLKQRAREIADSNIEAARDQYHGLPKSERIAGFASALVNVLDTMSEEPRPESGIRIYDSGIEGGTHGFYREYIVEYFWEQVFSRLSIRK
jgi:hypothetical protein